MAAMNTHDKGGAGESAAVDYLLSLGYAIEARNYRTKAGEIDIVAKAPDGTLVFVEVKAARSASCGNPLLRITLSKQRTIVKIAKMYMFEREMTNQPCRIDVIGVKNGKIDHIPNAFFA